MAELVDSPLFAWMAPFALLGPAVARWYWSHIEGRFFTVVEGHLYRSAALRPDRLLRKVRRYGIRAVIDLRSSRPEVEREKAALAEIGVAHYHLPSKQVPSAATVDAVLALLDREENLPALIHCNHGVRRAAQFEAIYRIEYQGWRNDRALSMLRWRSGFLGFRPGTRSHRFLRGYVPRHAREQARAS